MEEAQADAEAEAQADAEAQEMTWKWWGPLALGEGEGTELRIGPSRVRLARRRRSWRVEHLQGDDLYCADLEREAIDPTLLDEPSPGALHRVVAFEPVPEALWLQPMLADRPVVLRPAHPILVPPTEVVHVYISTPLWLSVESPNRRRPIVSFPFWRLSDTWFGTPLSGELCYAGSTLARRAAAEVVLGPHRAVTALEIRNETSRPLEIDRFSLPVPRLSLSVDDRGVFSTEDVVVRHRDDELHADVELRRASARTREGLTLVAPAREQGESRFAAKVLQSLFNVRF